MPNPFKKSKINKLIESLDNLAETLGFEEKPSEAFYRIKKKTVGVSLSEQASHAIKNPEEAIEEVAERGEKILKEVATRFASKAPEPVKKMVHKLEENINGIVEDIEGKKLNVSERILGQLKQLLHNIKNWFKSLLKHENETGKSHGHHGHMPHYHKLMKEKYKKAPKGERDLKSSKPTP